MGLKLHKTKTREGLTDFERFKVMVLKRRVSYYKKRL